MFGFPDFLIAAMLAQGPAPAAQTLYRVDVNLLLYRGEQIGARAGGGSESSIDGYVWMDGAGCLAGASSGTNAVPPASSMRWHYTAAVTRQSGADATVDVTWQRVSDPSSQTQHREMTVRPGETVTLEAIPVPSDNSCGITAARLSLSMGPATFSGRGGGAGGAARGVFSGGGRGTGASAGGGGGMGAGGRGANAGTGVGAGTGSGTAVAGFGGGGGRGGRGSGGGVAAGPIGYGGRGTTLATNATTLAQMIGNVNRDENSAPLFEIAGVSYDAELWLVHTGPGLTAEDTQRLPVRVSSSSDVVTFAPVSLQTPRGPATVEVAVVARVLSTTDSRPVLRVVIARSIRGAVDNMTSMGNSIKVIPSPAVGDVVSFEIPEGVVTAARGGGGRGVAAAGATGGRGAFVGGVAGAELLGGHQFSVRLVLKSKANR